MPAENFADRLFRKVKEKGTPLVVGLDPRLELLPEELIRRATSERGKNLQAALAAIAEFSYGVIDSVQGLVAAVKPQVAFYERFGPEGMQVFLEVCRYAREKNLIVIADVKRADIGTTAAAYAEGFLGKVNLFGRPQPTWDVDALTVNPYLGRDALVPFIQEAKPRGKGVFVLVKTSNPSSGELQDLKANGEEVYVKVARLIKELGKELIGSSGFSSVGAVVGATYPEEMRKLRRLMPEIPFLVPGLGAQGAKARDVLPAFNREGLGAVVAVSRSIIFAYGEEAWTSRFPPGDWREAIKAKARQTIGELRQALAPGDGEMLC